MKLEFKQYELTLKESRALNSICERINDSIDGVRENADGSFSIATYEINEARNEEEYLDFKRDKKTIEWIKQMIKRYNKRYGI